MGQLNSHVVGQSGSGGATKRRNERWWPRFDTEKVLRCHQRILQARAVESVNSDWISPALIEPLLPFDKTTNSRFCQVIQKDGKRIAWRQLLGVLSLISDSSSLDKAFLISRIFDVKGHISYGEIEHICTDLLTAYKKLTLFFSSSIDHTGSDSEIGVFLSSALREVTVLSAQDPLELMFRSGSVKTASSLNFYWSSNVNDENDVNGESNEATSAVPKGRSRHAICVYKDRIFLLGGRSKQAQLKDFWSYNISTRQWEKIEGWGEAPPTLEGHTMTAHKDSIYVFGGENCYTSKSETSLWTFCIKTCHWSRFRVKSDVVLPAGRRDHSAVIYDNALHIFGGFIPGEGSKSDLWSYDFASSSWHYVGPSSHTEGRKGGGWVGSGWPEGRHSHTAIPYGQSMWMFGGMSNLDTLKADIWRFEFGLRRWTRIKSSSSAPPSLYGHSASQIRGTMVILGGTLSKSLKQSDGLWIFDFDAQTWQKQKLKGDHPCARTDHAVAVTTLVIRDRCCPACSRSQSAPAVRQSFLDIDGQVGGQWASGNESKVRQRPNTCPPAVGGAVALSKNKVSPVTRVIEATRSFYVQQFGGQSLATDRRCPTVASGDQEMNCLNSVCDTGNSMAEESRNINSMSDGVQSHKRRNNGTRVAWRQSSAELMVSEGRDNLGWAPLKQVTHKMKWTSARVLRSALSTDHIPLTNNNNNNNNSHTRDDRAHNGRVSRAYSPVVISNPWTASSTGSVWSAGGISTNINGPTNAEYATNLPGTVSRPVSCEVPYRSAVSSTAFDSNERHVANTQLGRSLTQRVLSGRSSRSHSSDECLMELDEADKTDAGQVVCSGITAPKQQEVPNRQEVVELGSAENSKLVCTHDDQETEAEFEMMSLFVLGGEDRLRSDSGWGPALNMWHCSVVPTTHSMTRSAIY